MKTKTDAGNNVSRMGNWKTLGKYVHAMNVSRKMLPRLLTFIETDRPEFSPCSRVTLPETFCFLRRAIFNLLERKLACKQGLGKFQIAFSVHPLTLVKLSEVCLLQTSY